MKHVFLFVGLIICIGNAQGQWQLSGFQGSDISCVAQHPQDTNVILVGTLDSLFESTDGGGSWSFLVHFNGLPINHLVYDPLYYDTVYALLGNGSFSDGIYRSTDGGYNWSVLEWMLYPEDMAITNTNPLRIMIVGCDGPGIFKTEDDGNTWISWNTGLADSHVYAAGYSWRPDSQCMFLAGTAQGLFYRLADSSWVQASGIAVNVGVSSICYSASTNLGFATVGSGSWSDGMYVSTDNGYTWQVGDYWIYASDIAMNPLWQNYPYDTCGVFAGDSGLGVKYSSDCGATWTEVNSGLGNLFVNSLSFHPQDSTQLYAATQGGLYRYQYGPGIVENKIEACKSPGIRMPTVVRVGMPIPFERSSQDPIPCWVRIYDAAGRFERTELLESASNILTPIEQCGVYFLKVIEGTKQHSLKIIVVD